MRRCWDDGSVFIQKSGWDLFCGSRIFVEKAFTKNSGKTLWIRLRNWKQEIRFDDNSFLGAIVSKQHYEKILHIDVGRKEGGKILCGGRNIKGKGRCESGWYIEPTVIEGLSYNCRANQEEIFGPVVTITPFFETEEEVLMMANSTEYGLVSDHPGQKNLTRATTFSSKIRSGIVWINCWMSKICELLSEE